MTDVEKRAMRSAVAWYVEFMQRETEAESTSVLDQVRSAINGVAWDLLRDPGSGEWDQSYFVAMKAINRLREILKC